MITISSWGRLSHDPHNIKQLSNRISAPSLIKENKPGIAYGMGRSYGDVCLNPKGILWKTRGLDRFIQFDEQTGVLICESGVLLRDIQKLTVPRGWILAVTPGTQLITVGGAIANDVHGKNHHQQGSFGNHVLEITLQRTDGETIVCGPELQPDWFAATIGGLGLTGVILTAKLQLRKISGPWLNTETIPYYNLSEFFHLADTSESAWEHTVSWIDCITRKHGRGLFMRANPTHHEYQGRQNNKKITMPLVPPISLINSLTLSPFNHLYFNLKKSLSGKQIIHYEPFFYPLDNILEWNRMYGPKGFYQYQIVIPRQTGHDAIQAMLNTIARSGEGSFLAVLKTFGDKRSLGMLSFPRPGVTLALDFTNKGIKTLELFKKLDAIVKEAGGQVYLAKDARITKDFFIESNPNLTKFLAFRDHGISSALSRRLMGK